MNAFTLKASLFTVLSLGAALSGCSATSTEEEGPDEAIAETEQELGASICPAGVPAAINPGADQTLVGNLTGDGVQVYMCNATSVGFAWTFVAPQANLYGQFGSLVGTHFIGPKWQDSKGSSVGAAKTAGATVDPTAIPWLLLTANSHSAVVGRFSEVSSIQRLDTQGGLAPATTCDATNLGAISQVPYTAQYVFYRTSTTGKVVQCKG